MQARRRDDPSKSLAPEIEVTIKSLTQRPANSFASFDEALEQANHTLTDRIGMAERLVLSRIRAISELELYKKGLDQIAALTEDRKRLVDQTSPLKVERQTTTGILARPES